MAELAYAVTDDGVTFLASGHQYRVRRYPRGGGPAITLVAADGAVLHDDRFDPHDAKAREKFAAALNGRADPVGAELIVLASILDKEEKAKREVRGDASDSLEQGSNEPDLRPLLDADDQDLKTASAAAWDVLTKHNDPPTLFRFGSLPVRVARVGDDGAPATITLNEDRLRYHLARCARWFRETKEEVKDVAPPSAVVRDMLASPTYPLPVLRGIVEVPVFAPDGSLPSEPGYHAASGLFYAPARGFVAPAIPSTPSPKDVTAARSLLIDELLVDFPFTGDAELAHMVALLLLPFARALIPGPTPLHLIEKPAAGTGASLLADVVARVATGRPVGGMTEGREEDEWRKRITAKLRGAPTVLLIDNLRRRLDSAALSSVITTAVWEDRLLGTSDTLRLPVRAAWIATGNNPALSSELARRTVRIRMDAKRDRPWMREDFRHDPLIPWVIGRRSDLVGACLTLVQAWLAADRPWPAGSPVLGSFEDWSRVLAGVLSVAGIDGFLTNLRQFYESSDTEGADIRAFVSAWWEKHQGAAVGVADLFPIAVADDSGLDLGDKGERSQKIRLGKLLVELRDRHYQLRDGLTVRIDLAGTEKRLQRLRLTPINETVDQDGACGACGACVPPDSDDESDPDWFSVVGNESETYTDIHHMHPMESSQHDGVDAWDEQEDGDRWPR